MNADILQTDIGNIFYSNRALISMTWRWRIDTKLKIGYWHLNNFLLKDVTIGKIIETENTADPVKVWDCFNANIRGIFISQKAYLLKNLQGKQDNLRKQLRA